jgi:hypothetical protein
MKHAPAINCQCEMCDRYHVNAVLRAYADRKNVSRETTTRRFLEQREKGKPPVDPDAEQLAVQVGELAGNMLARSA